MLADPEMVTQAAALLPDDIRQAVSADDGVREAANWTAEEVLWPLTGVLFSPEVREQILDAHAAGRRIGLVIAPIPVLARIPWVALPLTDPAISEPLLLIGAADLLVGLPASLGRAHPSRTGRQRSSWPIRSETSIRPRP